MKDLYSLYVIPDRPVCLTGDKLGLSVVGTSLQEKEVNAEIIGHRGKLAEAMIKLTPRDEVLKLFELEAPKIPGRYELTLRVDGSVVDKVEFLVISPDDLVLERHVAFVWHHHQAPNVLPDGTYKYLWSVVHTASDELTPYGKGPYHYHAIMLTKHPHYRCTYNLSPSLLYQWSELLERGLKHSSGFLPSNSREAFAVREAVEIYKRSAVGGQVDILTSIYAHTIAGYLIEYLRAVDVVREEVEYGIEVTRRVIGVEPRGVWTPEMAFHMKLVDVYSELGLEYTVLDAKCHLARSEGDVGTHLEPYKIKGERGELLVFFRDTELSNHVSFKNNFRDPLQAWRLAYDLVLKLATRLLRGGVLTIALDGENWMIFAKNPPLTAIFYDKVLEFLGTVQREGYLQTTTLKEVAERTSQVRILTRVPTTSWLCGFTKWHGERPEHDVFWERVKRLYKTLLDYERVNGRDERARKARTALWHALDSDYWWAEFWEPHLITVWLEEAERLICEQSTPVSRKCTGVSK